MQTMQTDYIDMILKQTVMAQLSILAVYCFNCINFVYIEYHSILIFY